MSLRLYLLICYVIILAMLLYIATVGHVADPKVPIDSLVVLSPLMAAVVLFVSIYPSAARVPVERRTKFWAYKSANIRLYVGGFLAIIVTCAAVATAFKQ